MCGKAAGRDVWCVVGRVREDDDDETGTGTMTVGVARCEGM